MKHRLYYAWVGCMTCGGKFEIVINGKRYCENEIREVLLSQNYYLTKGGTI